MLYFQKDLIPVKFTPIADGDSKSSLISKGVSVALVPVLLWFSGLLSEKN